MLFSCNKDINFPGIKIGNNIITETTVAKFLGIRLDEKQNFENHITEMSEKVASQLNFYIN